MYASDKCNVYIINPEVLRLTFPIRDGILLKPFQLEHGKNLSEHLFQLRDSVHGTLIQR